ncbi:MAG: kaiB [Gammaproteobacteria bacterium]|nr:kaiB [Gammaproteobacteria bacterium]
MATRTERDVSGRRTVVVRLFVAGSTSNSLAAQQAIGALLGHPEFAGRVGLDLVDVLQNPRQALRAGLIATPTLLLNLEGRTLRFIGDLSRADQLIDFLSPALA